MPSPIWNIIEKHAPAKTNYPFELPSTDEWRRRDIFLETVSFAIPSPEAIAAIADFVRDGLLLEVGAGSGLWARLLEDDYAVNVKAIDNYSWSKAKNGMRTILIAKYFPVKKVHRSYAAIRAERPDVLMLCWPPYATSFAYNCLKAFSGNRLVYIGEGSGGCTGDDKFHRTLERDWREERSISIPQWWGVHDYLGLFIRKE